MSSLILSRRDVDFLLHEWLQVEQLTRHNRYAEHSRQTFDAALDTYETLASSEFAPHNKKNDQLEPHFDGDSVRVNSEIRAALHAFASAGLIAAAQSPEYGGTQLPHVVERAGMAFIMAANISTASYAILTAANASLLLAHGTRQQTGRYVLPMLDGRFSGTMCLSEPQAGSSLADITTRAEKEADGQYRLFGNKMWISAGDHDATDNIVHLVLAKIPDANGDLIPGVGGISLFVVPKLLVGDDGGLGVRNDVVVAGLNHKMGQRGTSNCLLNFGEGKFQPAGRSGAVGEIVGQEGKGLAYMFHMMNEARIAVGLGAVALGYTGYLHALEYARIRRQGRPAADRNPTHPQIPLIQHADVRRMLLTQKAYVEGGLALALYCAKLLDEVQCAASNESAAATRSLLDLLTPVTKSWPSQWCLAANDLAIQVHGGYGYTRDYNVEQFYRDNRLNAIHEGTHGIQALDLLGRKVGARNGNALKLLTERIEETRHGVSQLPALADHARELGNSWERLLAVTARLLPIDNPETRLANAVPYLEAMGHVLVAWLWLDQARVATARLAEDHPDALADFYQGKLAACRFFFLWELPRVEPWLDVLDSVDVTTLEMRNEWY